MATLKTFEVTFTVSDAMTIMDVVGYSHIKFESERRVYGAGRYYTVETAFIRASSLTALRAELKRVFGYRFEKYLYNRVMEYGQPHRRIAA